MIPNDAACETCRWWQQNGTKRIDWGVCELTGTHSGFPVFSNGLALAMEASHKATAQLETHSDFACTQWQRPGTLG